MNRKKGTKTIAIDIREAVHPEPAGKGIYNLKTTQELIKNKDIKWVLLSDRQTKIFKSSNNVKVVVLKQKGIKWHFAAAKYAKQNKVDHYFAPTSYITPKLLGKIPYTVVVHDLISFMFPKDHPFKPKTIEKVFLPLILKKAASIVTVSENTKEDLLHLFPKTDEEKISVSYNGVNLKEFKKSDKKEETIFSVGTLIPRKNIITLVRAFNLIQKDIPHTLLIGGGKGAAYDEIKKYIKDHKLEKRVKMLGYVSNDDLKKYYSSAEIFVYPSLYEGFGIPILEAFASACPVVCSNNSSIPEVVGECAVMFRSMDHEDLSKKMLYLLKSKEDQEIYVKNGLERVKQFTWSKVGKRLLKVLK
jgi:glycosyltransferase involved in cell wall biosynthesis